MRSRAPAVAVIAAAALFTAPPAGAAIRIPNLTRSAPELNLTQVERFPLTLPRGISAIRLETELDAARSNLSSRIDREQAADPRVRLVLDNLKLCADEAFSGATDSVASAASTGETVDFDELMWGGAVDCATAKFPEATQEAVGLAAEYITAQGDQVAQDAFFATASGETTVYAPLDTSSGRSDESDRMPTAVAIGAGLGGLLVVGGLVAYFTRRRPS